MTNTVSFNELVIPGDNSGPEARGRSMAKTG